jgi:5-amino-6-(5-phosphoribosylamino)uracil reductase
MTQTTASMRLGRPLTTVVLATSADGKISDTSRSHPRFGSQEDFDHLERQVAQADAVLFGAATLKAGGSAMRVIKPELIEQRRAAGLSEQPIQIVCSRSGNIDPAIKFFQQPIPRYLLTTAEGAQQWQDQPGFDQVLSGADNQEVDWHQAFEKLHQLQIGSVAVLGGGEIVAALLEVGLIDELHLTLCPLLLGGKEAPSPVEGAGFSQEDAPKLELVSCQQIGQELFLHYRVKRSD